MDNEERGKLLYAICAYALDEEIYPLDGVSKIAFMLIKPNLDSSRKKAENGSAGGHAGEGKEKQRKSKPKAKNSKNKAKENQGEQESKDKAIEYEKQDESNSENKNEYEIEKEYEKKKESYIPPKSPQQSQRTNNIKTQPDYKPEWFNRFMKAYPRGEKVKETMDVWDELRPDRELCDTMAEAIKKQLRSKQWQDKKYIPCADKWLREQRWMDKVEEVEIDDSWFM